MQDAFGIVALVALVPLISIQLVGIMYKYRRENYFGVPETKVVETDDIIIFPKKPTTKSEVWYGKYSFKYYDRWKK